MSEDTKEDNGFFGLCPICHQTDGTLSLDTSHGRQFWHYCHKHETKWIAWEDLADGTNQEGQEANQALLNSMVEVEPYFPPLDLDRPDRDANGPGALVPGTPEFEAAVRLRYLSEQTIQ